jgi:tetratricopeptide (TPR) repeat protein
MEERRRGATAGLRENIDLVRTDLTAGRYASAARRLVQTPAGEALSVRSTRLVLTLANRCRQEAPERTNSHLAPLWDCPEAAELVLAGNDRRNRHLHDLALECYIRALKLSPLCPEALYKRGASHMDLGDHAAAGGWLRTVPVALPQDVLTDQFLVHYVADSLYRLALIEQERDHDEMALRLLRRAARVSPKNRVIARALAALKG